MFWVIAKIGFIQTLVFVLTIILKSLKTTADFLAKINRNYLLGVYVSDKPLKNLSLLLGADSYSTMDSKSNLI